MSASPKKSFQIKVLPKPGEGTPAPKKKKSIHIKRIKKKRRSRQPLRAALLGIIALSVGGLYWVNFKLPQSKPTQASSPEPEQKKVTDYLKNSQRKAALQKLKVQVENQNALSAELPAFLPLEEELPSEKRHFGVELEGDPSMERVYDDLYGSSSGGRFMSPEERIGARLAQKKWLYEYQLNERKAFIKNFIEAARLAGYEVKIDENLVVTEVRPIKARPTIPLDQVLESMAVPPSSP